MECSRCGKEREEKDFLNNQQCYHCVYQKKLENQDPSIRRKCRECKAFLASKRWVYCSTNCAQKGEQKSKNDHWTKML